MKDGRDLDECAVPRTSLSIRINGGELSMIKFTLGLPGVKDV